MYAELIGNYKNIRIKSLIDNIFLETEPLKSLGINMSVANMQAFALSKGITKSWNSMTQSEQTLLRYNYLMEQSKDAQGDFAKTSGTFANQLRVAATTIKQLAANLATYLLPFLTIVLQKINGFLSNAPNIKANILGIINSFSKSNIGKDLMDLLNNLKSVDYFTLFKQTVKDALAVVKDIYDFFNNNWGTIKTIIEGVTAGLVAYKLAILAAAAAEKTAMIIEALSKAWSIATEILSLLRAGITLTAVAQDLLNIAMAANPFAVIAIAIALLVTAGLALYKNWDKISKWISNNWTWLKNQATQVFTSMGNWISNNVEWIKNTVTNKYTSMKTSIVNKFNEIKSGISNTITDMKTAVVNKFNEIKTGISNTIQNVKTTVINKIKEIAAAIVANPLFKVFEAIFKGILAIAIIVFVSVKNAVVNAFNSIKTAVTSVVMGIYTAVSARFMAIYNYIRNVVVLYYYVILTYWIQIKSAVTTRIMEIYTVVSTWFMQIYTAISSRVILYYTIIMQYWNMIKSYIVAVSMAIWNTIVQWFTTIYNSIAETLTSIWNTIVSIWESIRQSVSDVVSGIWQSIVSGFTSAKDGAIGIFEEMKASVLSVFDGVWESVKSIINNGISLINGFIGGVNNVVDKANSVAGVHISHVGTIPALANGGITNGPTLAMIGEGKEQEAVMPLSKLKNLINTGSIDGKGNSKNSQVSVQVIIQGNVIGNEEFADSMGQHIAKKVILAINNM